jgi:hypothetical protein
MQHGTHHWGELQTPSIEVATQVPFQVLQRDTREHCEYLENYSRRGHTIQGDSQLQSDKA